MAFIRTVPEDQAEGATREMYDGARKSFGFLPNLAGVFSHRPAVMAAWDALIASIRGNMDLRRYELVTMAAASELRSSYCLLAHGSIMLRECFDAPELKAVVDGHEGAPLSEAEKAIMRFAAQVVRDATAVTEADVDALRRHGLSEGEIFDIAAAAAVRCFFSKTLDALGAQPDAAFRAIDPDLRTSLVRGRPIAD
jgi:uncharacterized peroxidase-related enzyme